MRHRLGRSLRVAIVSDTHGVLDARIARVIASCDIAVHAGDIGSEAVLRTIGPRQRALFAVRGNNDTPGRWPRTEARKLVTLPPVAPVALPGGLLVVLHGDRAGSGETRHKRLRARFPRARAVVYGHSHRLVCDLKLRPWVLNPGAAGRSRTFGGPSCIVLSAGATGWRVKAVRFPQDES